MISSYNQDDVDKISSILPKPDHFDLVANGFGISKIHEVLISQIDDQILKWKKLSSDTSASTARIKIKGILNHQ